MGNGLRRERSVRLSSPSKPAERSWVKKHSRHLKHPAWLVAVATYGLPHKLGLMIAALAGVAAGFITDKRLRCP